MSEFLEAVGLAVERNPDLSDFKVRWCKILDKYCLLFYSIGCSVVASIDDDVLSLDILSTELWGYKQFTLLDDSSLADRLLTVMSPSMRKAYFTCRTRSPEDRLSCMFRFSIQDPDFMAGLFEVLSLARGRQFLFGEPT